MARETRYYIVPFEPVIGDRLGYKPKYLHLNKGRATGKTPEELESNGRNRNFRVDYYLIKWTMEEKDFDALDAMSDVIDVSRTEVATVETKSKLTAIGVDVSLAVSEDQVENRIFAWLSNEPSKTIATEPAFTNNPHSLTAG